MKDANKIAIKKSKKSTKQKKYPIRKPCVKNSPKKSTIFTLYWHYNLDKVFVNCRQ